MRPVSHVNRRKQLHELLAQHPDGLTRAEIRDALDMSSDQFNATKKTMPYVYIDRWVAKRVQQPRGGSFPKWVAVYCMVDLPPDAPIPDRKPTEDDLL
jgi:hypothetical protein